MDICKLCSKNPSRYTCPRCNIYYCSAQCYAGPLHSGCSEGFYKEQVQQQLHNHRAPPDSREKMKQMLKRLEEEDIATAAALSSFDLPGCETGSPQQEENDELDSDDDDDLETRLKGVDLDDSDRVWECLTEDERRQFRQLVQTGDVAAVLPPYLPWWQPVAGDADAGAAIVELDETEAQSFKDRPTNLKIQTTNSENVPLNSIESEQGDGNCSDVDVSKSVVEQRTSSENLSLVSKNLEGNVGDEATFNVSSSFVDVHSSSKSSESNNNPSKLNSSVKCTKSSSNSDIISKTTKNNITQTKCSSCCSAKPNTHTCSSCSLSSSSLSSFNKPLADSSLPSKSSSGASLGAGKKSHLKKQRNELVNAFPCVPAALRAKYPHCPPLPRVKLLSNLISVTPSPSLRYSLLNVMVGYAWLMRLYHGDLMDHSREAAEGLLCLCGSLSTGQVYCSCEEAAASVTMRALQHDWLCAAPEMAEAASADASLLLTRPRELPGYFLITALGHLKDLTLKAAKAEAGPNESSFMCSMVGAQAAVDVSLATPAALRATAHKLDFFMAYVAACKTDVLRFFATR